MSGSTTTLEWRDAAACVGYPESLFFPKRATRGAYNTARNVCARCPVFAQCRAMNDAAEGQRLDQIHGFFAGETPTERVRRRAGSRPRLTVVGKGAGRGRPAKPPEHGTPAGYRRHRYVGEAPCEDCRAAMAAYTAARRKGKAPGA